jgi:DNA replication and repair protein RecF
MILQRLLLQNFRSYASADFTFTSGMNFIIGPNTAGKSNIMEAIYLLSSSKSFRTEKDNQLLQFHKQVSHVKGKILLEEHEPEILEVILSDGSVTGSTIFSKKFLRNGVPKRRLDFTGTLRALLFDPTDLDIISGSPSLRREFLDEVLEQTDLGYRKAVITFTKALRHRNALLQSAKETGFRQEKQFSYWDELLIANGTAIHDKRAAFIAYLNAQPQALFPFSLVYDHSIISEERLLQYRDAESGSGVTLVGPHRDDIQVMMRGGTHQSPAKPDPVHPENSEEISVKAYASRGQQRLAVVQLKLLQLQYMREHSQTANGDKPVLLLDDIFSELDSRHIKHVLNVVKDQQTIITTTHKEFIDHIAPTDANVIELKRTHE